MKHIYWTKQGKFETENYSQIPIKKLHSPNENTPAYECSDFKEWWFEGEFQRLTGPARIWKNFTIPYQANDFYLEGEYYDLDEWLEYHPNQDKVFQAMMKLKYK